MRKRVKWKLTRSLRGHKCWRSQRRPARCAPRAWQHCGRVGRAPSRAYCAISKLWKDAIEKLYKKTGMWPEKSNFRKLVWTAILQLELFLLPPFEKSLLQKKCCKWTIHNDQGLSDVLLVLFLSLRVFCPQHLKTPEDAGYPRSLGEKHFYEQKQENGDKRNMQCLIWFQKRHCIVSGLRRLEFQTCDPISQFLCSKMSVRFRIFEGAISPYNLVRTASTVFVE